MALPGARRLLGLGSRAAAGGLLRAPLSSVAVPRALCVPAAAAASGAAAAATAAATPKRSFATIPQPTCLVGTTAPDFTLDAYMPSGKVEKLCLSELLQQHIGVCLLFYPLDFTYVCPTELLAYNSKVQEFKDLGWALVGISVDSVHSHKAWCELPAAAGGLGGLQFPLASDFMREVAAAYGLLSAAGFALRGCALVGPHRLLRLLAAADTQLGRSPQETLRAAAMISHLHAAANQNKVCPACWQQGQPAMEATKEAVAKHLQQMKAEASSSSSSS
ncbi:Zgc:110343, related [Eimeria tenella]|uniref:Zgc:110343, related n=1 Tax=Eimeria tenella TaxID=5802 RepID=U6KYA3_EIMTE|nr:Zgc:110343, related [Eimeria tenella]CDJ42921.1 Zgc:110343, related [Eimeria tenella]|eukprot:XP_013233671.1 Zgc:110343, related [Eimeria tenella]